MLLPDPRFADIEIAWSRRRAREFLNETVLPRLAPGRRVDKVAQKYVRYSPGKECRVLYGLRFEDGNGHDPAFATFAFGRRTRLRDIFAEHYAPQHEQVNANMQAVAPPLAYYSPLSHCLVELFPAAWSMPGLASALDLLNMSTQLVARGVLPAGSFLDDAQILRYRPEKSCVILYTAELPNGDRERLIGKLYGDDRRAEQMWHKLQTLKTQASGFALSRPIALFNELNMLVMDYLPGETLTGALRKAMTEEEASEIARLAARTLAAFHTLELPGEGQEPRTLRTEIDHVRRRATALHRVAPELAGSAFAILRRASALAGRHRSSALSLSHGDFKPTQVLVGGELPAIVDLDRAGPGDPAIDVGRFMAALRKETVANQRTLLRDAPAAFLAEYQALAGSDGLAQRARLAESVALVRTVLRKFERAAQSYARSGDDWRPLVLLDEATACLADLQ